MSYNRLNIAEREVIREQLALGTKPSEIARQLKRDRSTISRELKKHRSKRKPYRAFEAQRAAEQAASSRHCERKIDENWRLWDEVMEKLQLRWSPEQISMYLKQAYPQNPDMHISDESLYTYIYVECKGILKKALIRHLRQRKPHRGRRVAETEKRGKIPNMISIERRPVEVADRTVPGHWEGDLIMGAGNRSAAGTLVERSTRTLILVKLRTKDAPAVRRAFAREMKSLPAQLARSLTYDQGREMSEHALFTKDTKIKVYFAHPHSPWERGTNENTNGLVRGFFPKGTDFTKISNRQLKQVQQWLNERPRKTLGWKTPAQAFDVLLASEKQNAGSRR